MEKLQLPEKLLNMVNWVSEKCDKHQNQPKMLVNGKAVCPKCELERETKKLEQRESEKYQAYLKNRQYDTFKRKSIIDDETIMEATLDSFIAKDPEEIENKRIVLEVMQHYLNSERMNFVIQGKQGAGKSHLLHGLLQELNESRRFSCLYVNMDKMMRMMRGSIRNKESQYTEEYFVNLLSSVDFLGLDDLGSETGSMDTDQTATNYVQRVLYGITSARQKKSTIITTNLSSAQLFQIYDKKLVSRLLKRPKVVMFKNTKDKRVNDLPF